MELRSGKRMRPAEAAAQALGTPTFSFSKASQLPLKVMSKEMANHPAEPPFEPTGPSAIETTLPDDILLHIFKQLERDEDRKSLALVSKHWRRLTGAVCTRVTVPERAGGDRLLQVLRFFGPGPQTLNLNYVPFVRDSDLRSLPLMCPNLTSLTLHGHNNFSDDGLCALAQACGSRLLELNLSRCQGLSFRGVAAACQFLSSLHRLDLSNVKGQAKVADIDPLTVAAFAVESRSLGLYCDKIGGNARGQRSRIRTLSEERHLKGSPVHHPLVCSRCESECVGTEFDSRLQRASSLERGSSETDAETLNSAITSIAQSCTKLRTLLLRDSGAPTELSDEGLVGLTSGPCTGTLTALDLSFCEGVTDVGLLKLVRRCPNLTELSLAYLKVTSARDVSRAEGLTSGGLAHVLAQCAKLTSVDLSGNMLSREWFRQLRVGSKSLVKLDLTQCKMEPGVPWNVCLSEEPWSALTCLDLLECDELNNRSLRAIARAGVALKVLRISGSDHVTDKGLRSLGKRRGGQLEELVIRRAGLGHLREKAFLPGAPWPKLHTLALSECDYVGNGTLESIARNCSALTSLEAGFGFCMSGLALSNVLDGCKKLEKLMLFGNHHLDELQPGPPCPSLRQLDISNCPLRSADFQTLAVRCPNLESVDVSENWHLDGEGLMALAHGCTRLDLLDIRNCPKVTDASIVMALQTSSSLERVYVTRKRVSRRLEILGIKQECKVVCCPPDCGR